MALNAGVAKQADASALGAGEATRGGSSPSARIRPLRVLPRALETLRN